MNKQALCVPSSALHTGQSLYRITVELGAWTSTSNSASLRRLMILSNYAGSSLTPLSYDGSGKVTALNTLNATTLQEGGTALSNKYLGKTAKASDSDKLDGNDSTYYQKALPTTTTSGKVLKSTTTAGTVQWGDVTTSVTSGSSDLVTSGGVYTYVNAKSTTIEIVDLTNA